METLGTLCDKLTIVKLKQYHTNDKVKRNSLSKQELNLIEEIDDFLNNTITGIVPANRLVFASNKVYKKKGNEIPPLKGMIGKIFSELAKVNCELWHEQEKVYEFEKVPAKEKDKIVKQLALLNLKRNQCIDKIDTTLQKLVKK